MYRAEGGLKPMTGMYIAHYAGYVETGVIYMCAYTAYLHIDIHMHKYNTNTKMQNTKIQIYTYTYALN
jgi:hypothetical protein